MKALVLLSGGLDSRLACRIMQEQLGPKNVEAVFFLLPFGEGCCSDKFCVFNFAQKAGMKLHIVDFTKGPLFNRYIAMLRKPKHGRGAGMNPCVDCHIFMLKEAGKLAKKVRADLLVTGEVLGERPMSQHMKALRLIEKEAGIEGRLLRPLSAKLLPQTMAERNGLVNRDALFNISGRSRRMQMDLAKRFNIGKYPAPGGGCLLTYKEFAAKVRDLFRYNKSITPRDVNLLRLGRHFRVGRNKLVVGRNKSENEELLKLRENDYVFYVPGYGSPIALLKGPKNAAAIKLAASVTAAYSDKKADVVLVKYGKHGALKKMHVKPAERRLIDKLLLT